VKKTEFGSWAARLLGQLALSMPSMTSQRKTFPAFAEPRHWPATGGFPGSNRR